MQSCHSLQVQYILGLENFKIIRRRGYLNREQCSESESWLWRKWDCLREIDYDSQKEKLEELCKDTDEKSRVSLCICVHVCVCSCEWVRESAHIAMDISLQKLPSSKLLSFVEYVQEKVTKTSNAVGDIQERLPALERSHRELQQSMEHIAKLLQELGGKTKTQ